jgi:hypothetical protein
VRYHLQQGLVAPLQDPVQVKRDSIDWLGILAFRGSKHIAAMAGDLKSRAALTNILTQVGAVARQ